VPFVADTPLAVILKHISDPLPPPSAIKKDIPAPLEQVILKALAKEPADRYATAEEFLSAWRRALGETESSRRPPESKPVTDSRAGTFTSTPTAAPQSSGSSTGWVVGCLIVACLAFSVAGIGIAFFNWQGPAFLTPSTNAPPPTSTSVPTRTPLPTVTFAPIGIGETLLEDDFSQVNAVWGTLTNPDYSIEYDGEALRMQVFQQENWFAWSTPNNEIYSDVRIEVTVTNNDGEPTTAFGILCHQQTESSDSYYYLAVTPGGQYAIAIAKEGESDVFFTNDDQWGDSTLIAQNKDTYRVGADCGYGVLTLYVDGQVIDSVSDSTFTSGVVGLFTWSGDNVSTADVTFDDFNVRSLE